MPDPLLRIPVRLDLDQLDRDKTSLLRDLARLEGKSVNIDIELNDSSIRTIESRLSDLDSTVNADLDVGDGNLSSIESRLDDLDAKITPDVDVNFDDGGASDLLEDIRNIGAVDLVMNLSGSAANVLMGGANTLFEVSGLGGILEMDTALAELEARTGQIIPEADTLINDIFTNGWGESRAEIANVLALANQLGVPFEELENAATNAFEVAAVTGEDTNDVLRTMVNLSRNELVDSYDQASDAIVGGFQNGLNIGDDFLDTLNEYGSTFSDMDLSIDEVLGILNSGLEAGIDNTDRVADAMREFNIRTQEGTEGVQEAVSNLDLEAEFADLQAGDLSTAEFLDEVIVRLSDLDEALQSPTAIELFGTQFEDFSVDTFLTALGSADEAVIEFEGSADKAGIAISSTLPAAWERMQRVVSTGIGTALDEELDITGFIDESTVALQDFFDSIQAGDDFNTAFTVAFEGTRLGDIIQTLQNTLSDFIFSFLSAIRSVVDAIPGASTSGIDNTIANLGAVDLQLDFATAFDGEDISTAVQQAVDRGVNDGLLLEQLTTAYDTALANDDLATAYSILQDIQGLDFANVTDFDANGIININDATQGLAELHNLGEIDISGFDIAEIGQLLLDVPAMSEGIETQIAEAFDTAINEGDVATALELGPVLDSMSGDGTGSSEALAEEMRMALEASLENAINAMDSERASEILADLGDFAPPDLVDANQQLTDYLVSTGEITAPLEETADSVVASVDETTDAVTTSLDETEAQVDTTVSAIESRASDLDTTYAETGTAVQDMATVTDESLLAAYTSVDTFVTNSEARLVRLADIIGGVNEGWETLIGTAMSMPAGAFMGGGAGGSSTTNNTTNTFNVNNQNGAAAQASNSLFEQVGGGMPQ